MTTIKSAVDGDCLVIPSLTALPRRCVRTNVDISEQEYTAWDIPFISRWLALLMLISWFLLLFVPGLVRRRCKFKAGLSASVRRRYFYRKLFAAMAILAPFLMIVLAFFFESGQWVIWAASLILPCTWVGFVIIAFYVSPLKVVRCEDQHFWIRGCSPEFLASLNGNPN